MRILHSAQSAVASNGPDWPSMVSAAASTVTAIVAVSAAVAAYFKYLRGRIFKPRLALELFGSVVTLQNTTALHIQVAVRNDGQSGVVLDPCFRQSLAVFVADDPVWEDATQHGDGAVLWYDGDKPHRELAVLEDPGLETYDVPAFQSPPPKALDHEDTQPDRYVLEPGEQARSALLVPVAQAHAYLLQLTIHACSHTGWLGRWRHKSCEAGKATPDMWRARAILCAGDTPRRTWRWWH